MFPRMQMHPRALYVTVMLSFVLGDAGCDDQTRWYNGLHAVVKNCPTEAWNNSGEEFLEKFWRCVQQHALAALDSLLADDVIQVFEGLDLIRFHEDRLNSTDSYRESDMGNNTNWTAIIIKRLLQVLRTHVFKVNVDHFTNNITSPINNSGTDVDNNIFEGRRRRHRHKNNHMVPMVLMGFLLMGSILIPMGFQFLAVLGGKALLLAKMALILSSIQGLKKIATNGVNYGLYHTPLQDGWHERSHIEPPPHLDLPFPPHIRP